MKSFRTEEAGFMVMQTLAENPNDSSNQISNVIRTVSATSVKPVLKTRQIRCIKNIKYVSVNDFLRYQQMKSNGCFCKYSDARKKQKFQNTVCS